MVVKCLLGGIGEHPGTRTGGFGEQAMEADGQAGGREAHSADQAGPASLGSSKSS